VLDVPESLLIGRDPASCLVLDDPKVSRRHATITAGALGTGTVEDHASKNGTWVNDKRIGEPFALSEGDRVRVGGSEFRVTYIADDDDPRLPQFARPGLHIVSGGQSTTG
jgi:pSer/pThr/pTyr-binding forkhead associated (FHA) protein